MITGIEHFFVFPLVSNFHIPVFQNATQTKIINEFWHRFNSVDNTRLM